MSLEDAIHDALARGEFVHLSVAATGKTFKATFASASRAGGYSSAEADHPTVAMVRAIGAAPMRRLPVAKPVEISADDEALS